MKKTRFNEFLIGYNDLDEYGFNEWIFYPGMLFNVLIKWWGNLGRRSKPHEGLDLFLYRDKSGKHHKLNEEIKIPVIFEGEVVKIDNDYLGKSVFLRHEIFNSDERQLYTVYGHVLPHKSIIIGESLLEGKIIGNISDIKGKRKSVPSHLHITIGWAPLTIPS